VLLADLNAHATAPLQAEFGADDYVRVVIPGDRLVVIDATTGEQLWQEPFQPEWIANPPPPPRGPGGPFAILAKDYTLLRDPHDQDNVRRLDFGIGNLFEMSVDQTRAVTFIRRAQGERDSQIGMIDLASGSPVWTADVSGPGEGWVRELRFSRDERRVLALLAASPQSSVFLKVLNAIDGRQVASLTSESSFSKFTASFFMMARATLGANWAMFRRFQACRTLVVRMTSFCVWVCLWWLRLCPGTKALTAEPYVRDRTT
jgi:hypothetical protein